jgi:hypothetical protein
LRDGHLKLGFEHVDQLLLDESGVCALLLSQPGPSLRRPLGGVTVTMVNECFPRSPSLVIATTQFWHIVPAVEEAQFFTESVKVLSLIETLEKLLLSQSTFDLSGGVAFHTIPPGLR